MAESFISRRKPGVKSLHRRNHNKHTALYSWLDGVGEGVRGERKLAFREDSGHLIGSICKHCPSSPALVNTPSDDSRQGFQLKNSKERSAAARGPFFWWGLPDTGHQVQYGMYWRGGKPASIDLAKSTQPPRSIFTSKLPSGSKARRQSLEVLEEAMSASHVL